MPLLHYNYVLLIVNNDVIYGCHRQVDCNEDTPDMMSYLGQEIDSFSTYYQRISNYYNITLMK